MADRWISYSKAEEILKDWYERKLNKIMPNVIINKSCIQRFEKLLEEVLEYDLMADNNTLKSQERREYYYKLTFIAEEYTKLLKKLKKEANRETLDYIADNVFANFNTFEDLDKGFYSDLYAFLQLCAQNNKELIEAVNTLFLAAKVTLYEDVQNCNKKMLEDLINGNMDNYLKNNASLLEKFDIETFYNSYEIDTSLLSFDEAVVILLRLKIYILMTNIMLKKQYEHYSIFSKIPLLNVDNKMSVLDIVRTTTSYKDYNDLMNKARKFQRQIKKDYELFEKKVSKKTKLAKLKNMKYYFLQLLILSEESNDEGEASEYLKTVKDTKRIVYKIIKNEHLKHEEWDYILSYIIYKDVEYYVKDKTFDFMKIRLVEESKIIKENLFSVLKVIEEVFFTP